MTRAAWRRAFKAISAPGETDARLRQLIRAYIQEVVTAEYYRDTLGFEISSYHLPR